MYYIKHSADAPTLFMGITSMRVETLHIQKSVVYVDDEDARDRMACGIDSVGGLTKRRRNSQIAIVKNQKSSVVKIRL